MTDVLKKIPSYLYILECSVCKRQYSPNNPWTTCIKCGKSLLARYDIEEAKNMVSKSLLLGRPWNVWRFAELMPVQDHRYRFTLGEGGTPLLHLKRVGGRQGLMNLFLKDEGQNPTGTFKSRGLGVAVSRAVELGITDFVIPTAGNAGAALAAYCARTGAIAHVYMPRDAPDLIKNSVKLFGGNLVLVHGLISDAGNVAEVEGKLRGWFNVSTLKEPYRVEGKKTMGLELAEQLNWTLPDVIVYPTGGGTGIIGMWKAFEELTKMGFIEDALPRMVSVQAEGCAPIVRAFKEGKKESEYWENARTIAPGLRVPKAFADYLILDVIRKSGGTAVSVSDASILSAMRDLVRLEGILQSPEGAAPLAAVKQLIDEGFIDNDERVVMFGTGSGYTTPESWFMEKDDEVQNDGW